MRRAPARERTAHQREKRTAQSGRLLAHWAQQHPVASPPARTNHAMAYDSARRKVVLFGGYAPYPVGLSDTWEYDGLNWALRTLPASPPGRFGHAMAYDELRGTKETWRWIP